MKLKTIEFCRSCILTPVGFLQVKRCLGLRKGICCSLEELEHKQGNEFLGPVQNLSIELPPSREQEAESLLVCVFLDSYEYSERWHRSGVGELNNEFRTMPVDIPRGVELVLVSVAIADDFLELVPQKIETSQDEFLNAERETIVKKWVGKLREERQHGNEECWVYFFFRLKNNLFSKSGLTLTPFCSIRQTL